MMISTTYDKACFRFLAMLCCVLQVLDWHSTFIYHDIKTETNVLLLKLAHVVGFIPALSLFKVAALFLTYVLVRLRVRSACVLDVWGLGIGCFFYSVIVTRNYFS